jgi:hypothetical protein
MRRGTRGVSLKPRGREADLEDPGVLNRQRTSSFDYDRLFTGYENGKVFVYDTVGPNKFKEMLSSSGKAASVEHLLTFPILAAPWEIKGVKGDKGEAEFISELFKANQYNGGMKIPMDRIIAQMTYAETVRRVYFEKIPTVRESDGMFIWDKISWCPPETCELALNAQTGDYEGFRQVPMMQYGPRPLPLPKNNKGYIFVPPKRGFVYIHGQWRDPIDGFSSMQVPYWCWETIRKLIFIWYQYLENQSLPKTVVKNADEAQAINDAKKFAMLRSRDVLGLSSESEFESVESSGAGAAQFIEAIRWLESEMSHSVLGGFMDLTSSAASGKGSYALSADQSTLFLRTRRVVARDMARNITDQIIAPLIRWNFGREAPVPQFTFGPLSEANEDKVLDLFSQITQTSQATRMPNEFMEMLTIRVANILELDADVVRDSFTKMQQALVKDADKDDPFAKIVGGVAAAQQMMGAAASGEDPLAPKMDDGNAGIPKPPNETTSEDK